MMARTAPPPKGFERPWAAEHLDRLISFLLFEPVAGVSSSKLQSAPFRAPFGLVLELPLTEISIQHSLATVASRTLDGVIAHASDAVRKGRKHVR